MMLRALLWRQIIRSQINSSWPLEPIRWRIAATRGCARKAPSRKCLVLVEIGGYHFVVCDYP
jgi:hypothetical protein